MNAPGNAFQHILSINTRKKHTKCFGHGSSLDLYWHSEGYETSRRMCVALVTSQALTGRAWVSWGYEFETWYGHSLKILHAIRLASFPLSLVCYGAIALYAQTWQTPPLKITEQKINACVLKWAQSWTRTDISCGAKGKACSREYLIVLYNSIWNLKKFKFLVLDFLVPWCCFSSRGTQAKLSLIRSLASLDWPVD